MSTVRGPADVHLEFDHGDDAPSRARAAVCAVAHGEGGDLLEERAMLVASELVTHVVRHTHRGGTLRAWKPTRQTPLRLEVADRERTAPQIRDVSDADVIGLRLVDRICDWWGAEATDDGTVVWAELRPRDVRGPAERPPASGPPRADDLADHRHLHCPRRVLDDAEETSAALTIRELREAVAKREEVVASLMLLTERCAIDAATAERAFATSDVVGEARGILVASLGCTPTRAAEILAVQAATDGRVIDAVAGDLVLAWTTHLRGSEP